MGAGEGMAYASTAQINGDQRGRSGEMDMGGGRARCFVLQGRDCKELCGMG